MAKRGALHITDRVRRTSRGSIYLIVGRRDGHEVVERWNGTAADRERATAAIRARLGVEPQEVA